MLVTRVEQLDKKKCGIYLDNGESFALYKSEMRILKVKEGAQLEDKSYRAIMENVLPRRAKLRAMNLLKARDYTRYQLESKLRDGLFPKSIIDIAVEYVSSYGYIDDLRYAKCFIEEKLSISSLNEIKRKLLMKGIDKETISKAMESINEEESGSAISETSERERELIQKTLEKRGYTDDWDYEDKQKLLAYFYRRGFDIDVVRGEMEKRRTI